MKSNFLLSLVSIWTIGTHSYAQLITTEPAIPLDKLESVITFDASQGDKGLMNYTGDVYAHTGVITDKSLGEWLYVRATWEVNIPDCKLTRLSTNLYQLSVSPSIREYYNVPADEKILSMAFVFRSSDGSLSGRDIGGDDIFVPVAVEGLSLSILQPAVFPIIIAANESFVIEIAANESDSISLFSNNQFISSVQGNYLRDTITGPEPGRYMIRAVASNDTGMVADSFYYHVRKPAEISELPLGIRDGINYVDSSTVVLALFAPHKEYVYAIGDFNNWEIQDEYLMDQAPEGDLYWLEISNLEPRREYIFQYLVDGSLKIADPYAEKIIDPANDQYIPEETYPGLISYPEGKTTQIASVLQTGQHPYAWQVDRFIPENPSQLVIYELLVRDFTTRHSFKALTDTLGYLQRLGINAIELMPVNEFEGNVSWGYNPSFYFAPDKYYGPKNDLKRFIDECHKRNIAVILDMVLNHAYDQCPFVKLYFDGQKPTSQSPWFNVDHNFTNPVAQWGNDFNHESLFTQQLVDSINRFWLLEYKVDGFRFDFTKGFGNNIKGSNDSWGSAYDADRIRLLKRMSDAIWESDSNAIIIMEHLAENLEEEELADHGMWLWGNMNYTYAEAAMGWNESGKSDFKGISYQERTWNNPHLLGYMESHDEERLMFKCVTWGNGAADYQIQDTATALQRMALNAAFFIPVPGPKMIWQFGERGYDLSIEDNGKLSEKPPRWEYMNDPRRLYLYNVYSSLISLKRNYPVFETTDYTMNVYSSLKRIILRHAAMDVVILGNFDIRDGNIAGNFPETGTWYNYFSGDSINILNSNDLINLRAGECRLYTSVRLQPPDIGTRVRNHTGNNFLASLRLYPNPAGSYLYVDGFPETVSNRLHDPWYIEIVDITGNVMIRQVSEHSSSPVRIDITSLPSGIYALVLKNREGIQARNKFMVSK